MHKDSLPPCPNIQRKKTPPLSFLPPSCIIALWTRFLLTDYQTLTSPFRRQKDCFQRTTSLWIRNCCDRLSPLELLSELIVNSSHFTAYRNLSQLLFPDGKVVLLVKHGSVLRLTYGNFVSTLFGNWSTSTIARGCKCPGCFILKFSSDQLLTLMENSLQLERHVHGFPLIWAKGRYSVTEKRTASILGLYHFKDQCTVQFRRNRTDRLRAGSCRLYRLYKDFPWGAYQFIPMNFYTKAFACQRQFGFYTGL